MSTQTVFRFPTRTSYTKLALSQESIPAITKHEVLIRIRAVALNSRDIQVATGRYPFPASDNLIPCSDGAGDIVAVGESVRNLTEGDRVVVNFDIENLYGAQQGWLTCQGGFIDGVLAQYVVRPASSVVKVPATAPQSYSELASLVCAGVTAWNGLFGNVPLKPGQTVLVQASRALELVGDKGIDHIIEIGGVGTIEQSLKAIAYGGVISVIGYLAEYDESKMPNVPLLALGKTAVVRGVLIGPKCMLEDLVTFADRAKLKIPVEKEYGYTRDNIVAAYKELETGGFGKICIRLDSNI
ncbi:hypothetical protein AbraIFM66951_005866 [Aspergillus brasiliensis]|uniref:Enoyl reductase (ER) domain-containing protein n=1 Tax=Aspergillus brasiliensis TaxID=319629 RepID=A0A9W6DMC7_9EURO|nr:hypothetical protein AbraCBS73388_006119 [Aspergillus brasiliensis]GKZ44090.1 hypothetical protein AbraIFM66951_005866 [Aspergillus brasiliensis]